jgi:hypothetical protein
MTREQKLMQLNRDCSIEQARKEGYDVMLGSGTGLVLSPRNQGYNPGAPISLDRQAIRACMEQRVSKIGLQSKAEPAPTATSTASSAATLDTWKDAPVLRVGDEWSYRWESPRGGGTFVWRVSGEETVDGTDSYIIDTGTRLTYYRKSDLAELQEKERDVLVFRNRPPRQIAVWPLFVGREWEASIVRESPRERRTNNWLRTWRVESKEQITVPAGSFETFKVVERDKWTGEPTLELWWAPQLKWVARWRTHLSYGVSKSELTAFKLMGEPRTVRLDPK